MNEENWRESDEFAALYPVIRFLKQPRAIELHARVTEYCQYLAVMIREPDGYRLAAQTVDLSTLATEHGLLVALVDELQQSDAALPQLALPAVCNLRDTLAAEGLRRGHILHAGDVSDDRAFAACVAMQLAGPEVRP